MKLNVMVAFGGRSVEHEISVISAMQCIDALDKSKYQVFTVYIAKDGTWYTGKKLLCIENFKDVEKLISKCQKIFISPNAGESTIYKSLGGIFGKKELAKIDVIFPVFHGTNGEDGVVQGFFELMNVPYVGCDVLSSAVTMDKVATKLMMRSLSIPVLDDVWFYSSEWMSDKNAVLKNVADKFTYPMIVKPGNLGSSIGVSTVNDDKDLENAIDLAVSMSLRVIVEPKIVNLKEVNCAVLGDHSSSEVSVCEEPIKGGEILSYSDKYLGSKAKGVEVNSQGMSGASRKIPADISSDVSNKIRELAKDVFTKLGCCGVVRIDFLIDQNTDQIYLCELNSIPGSLSFYLWEPSNKSFGTLVDDLIFLAIKRHREKNNLILSYETNILRNFQGGIKGFKK